MKLIRLKSEEDNLTFKGNLDTNIILKANSSIGLKNLSFKKQEIPIFIGDPVFNYTIGEGPFSTPVILSTGMYYKKSLIFDLSVDLEAKMNENLSDSNAYVIGGRWTVLIDQVIYRFSFNFSQNPVINIAGDKMNGYKNYGINDSSINAITKLANENDLPDSAIGVEEAGSENYECFRSSFRPDPTNTAVNIPDSEGSGCGFLRVQINAISASNNGFFIGMTDKKITAFNDNYDIARFNYAIRAKNSASPYEYMTNVNAGSATLASINPRVNDILEIALSDGKMRLTIYSETAPIKTVIFEALNEYKNTSLYPYLVFYTGTGNIVQNYEFTPFNPPPTAGLSLPTHLSSNYTATVAPIQELYQRNYILNLGDYLAPLLGFRDSSMDIYGKICDFVSDDSLIFVDTTECYIILLENISLLSYDMTVKKRGQRSILDVIQNIREKTDEDVYYNSDTPLMIDFDNAQPIMLKNLNVQILDASDNRPISQGFGNMALVIN